MRAFPIIKAAWLFCGAAAFSAAALAHSARTVPDGFVRLSAVVPGIVEDMRYATRNNVLGRPLAGYAAGACILRRRAADALAKAQTALERQGYGLMVFDCYRPARAVRDLVSYAFAMPQALAPYHPRVGGADLLAQGYVARRSGHSTGLAVDLTLIHLDAQKRASGGLPCGGPLASQEADMGSGFDCFDPMAGDNAALTDDQKKRRTALRDAMIAAGFTPYSREWWHFALPPRDQAERQSMDFTIR